MLKYTKEIEEYIKKNCLGNTAKKLVSELKKKFNFETSVYGLRTYMNTKGYRFSNRKINKPKNYNQRAVGDERIKKDMVQVKVAEPNIWKQKQVYIWEKEHKEKVKKGEIVIFIDGNTKNFKIDNLHKVNRKVAVTRNHLYKNIKGIEPYLVSEIKHLIRNPKREVIKNEKL